MVRAGPHQEDLQSVGKAQAAKRTAVQRGRLDTEDFELARRRQQGSLDRLQWLQRLQGAQGGRRKQHATR
eukprot:7380370-Prymnesium_polylepis.1